MISGQLAQKQDRKTCGITDRLVQKVADPVEVVREIMRGQFELVVIGFGLPGGGCGTFEFAINVVKANRKRAYRSTQRFLRVGQDRKAVQSAAE